MNREPLWVSSGPAAIAGQFSRLRLPATAYDCFGSSRRGKSTAPFVTVAPTGS